MGAQARGVGENMFMCSRAGRVSAFRSRPIRALPRLASNPPRQPVGREHKRSRAPVGRLVTFIPPARPYGRFARSVTPACNSPPFGTVGPGFL